MNARFAKQLVTKMFALESHCSMGTNFELQKKTIFPYSRKLKRHDGIRLEQKKTLIL